MWEFMLYLISSPRYGMFVWVVLNHELAVSLGEFWQFIKKQNIDNVITLTFISCARVREREREMDTLPL